MLSFTVIILIVISLASCQAATVNPSLDLSVRQPLSDGLLLEESFPSSPVLERNRSKRSGSTIDEYLVVPKNATDQDQNNKTEAFIKTIVKLDEVKSFTDFRNELLFWRVNITQSQVDEIKKHEGVSAFSIFR